MMYLIIFVGSEDIEIRYLTENDANGYLASLSDDYDLNNLINESFPSQHFVENWDVGLYIFECSKMVTPQVISKPVWAVKG